MTLALALIATLTAGGIIALTLAAHCRDARIEREEFTGDQISAGDVQ